MTCITRRLLGSLVVGGAAASVSRANETPSPRDKTILTVSGKIAKPNAGDHAAFSRAALEALGNDGFETNTPWYDKPVRFDGVKMARLMQAVGAAGTTVTAIALNDYTTEIPISDFAAYGVILALKRNGEYMPVRDKGPLFIVYPYDSASELRAQQYYSRSAWQVAKLVVK